MIYLKKCKPIKHFCLNLTTFTWDALHYLWGGVNRGCNDLNIDFCDMIYVYKFLKWTSSYVSAVWCPEGSDAVGSQCQLIQMPPCVTLMTPRTAFSQLSLPPHFYLLKDETSKKTSVRFKTEGSSQVQNINEIERKSNDTDKTLLKMNWRF